ncbi:MAG TPA: CAP domain-containing protein [Candidatus Saccharimonadales bacterium]|nr:CAP domain-containing protein [Candidatus Saccharimonadales bacterium]
MSLTAKPRVTAHSKKRQGGHHRHSKSYIKAYWPYLPMVAIVASGVFINSLLTSSQAVLGWQNNFSNTSLLTLTNLDRENNHEPDLTLTSLLDSAAQAKAEDMVKNNYWSHVSSSGKTPQSFIVASGYQYSVAGENLAYGFNSAVAVNQAWMNSQDHRANILDAAYTNVGFGIAESPNYLGQGSKVIVVAEYGQPTGSGVLGVVNQPAMQNVSRLNTITGMNATWPEIALTIIITASVIIIAFKHGLGFRKFILESEEYIVKHPLLDITIVFIATLATILSHTTGLIG